MMVTAFGQDMYEYTSFNLTLTNGSKWDQTLMVKDQVTTLDILSAYLWMGLK